MADYRLTPAARRDLEGIWRFTCAQWDIVQADRYLDQFTDSFRILAQTPGIGPTCDHIQHGTRRWPMERHMIYFRITPYGMAVIRILHARMDPRRHLARGT